MKKREAINLRKQIEHSAILQTDEDALNSVWMFEAWKSDTDYAVGDRIRENETLYKCVQAHHSLDGWNPSVTPALWVEISLDEYPEWIRPLGSTDAYHKNDKVSHNSKHWVSDVDGNVWEPGIYGWSEIGG